MAKLPLTSRLGFAFPLAAAVLFCAALAQKKPDSPPSSLCDRDSALQIIQEQLAITKSFDDVVKRIGVLIRTADLLSALENEKARALPAPALPAETAALPG